MRETNGYCPQLEWALSEIAQGRIAAVQKLIDETPVGDSISLITAVNTCQALRADAQRKEGWQPVDEAEGGVNIQLAEGITIDATGQVEYRGERRGHIAYLSKRNAVSALILAAWNQWLGREQSARAAA